MIEELKHEIADLKRIISTSFGNPVFNDTHLNKLQAAPHYPVAVGPNGSDYRHVPVSRELIAKFITWFFKANRDIIDSIFQDARQRNDFSFFIVLRPDTEDNRNIFFDFLDIYERIQVHARPSVFFQFVPQWLKEETMDKKIRFTF